MSPIKILLIVTVSGLGVALLRSCTGPISWHETRHDTENEQLIMVNCSGQGMVMLLTTLACQFQPIRAQYW